MKMKTILALMLSGVLLAACQKEENETAVVSPQTNPYVTKTSSANWGWWMALDEHSGFCRFDPAGICLKSVVIRPKIAIFEQLFTVVQAGDAEQIVQAFVTYKSDIMDGYISESLVTGVIKRQLTVSYASDTQNEKMAHLIFKDKTGEEVAVGQYEK